MEMAVEARYRDPFPEVPGQCLAPSIRRPMGPPARIFGYLPSGSRFDTLSVRVSAAGPALSVGHGRR